MGIGRFDPDSIAEPRIQCGENILNFAALSHGIDRSRDKEAQYGNSLISQLSVDIRIIGLIRFRFSGNGIPLQVKGRG